MTASVPTATRLPGLDVLRFLAIMLVLGRHMESPPGTWPSGWRSVFLMWQRGGWVGVDLFFVLSGFLVSGLLFAEYKSRGSFSIGRFYVRRGWKIYPPFFTLIGATVILYGWPDDWELIASEVTFLQSYFPGLWGHTWSLAVEEHFYLLLPLVLILILKLNRGSTMPLEPIFALAGGVAVLTMVLRLLNWQHRAAYSHLTHLFPSHLRLDALFFGVAISYAYHFHTRGFVESLSPWRRPLIVAGILLLTPAFAFPLETTPLIFTVGFTLFYVGSGMLLVGVLLCDVPRNRPVIVLAALGAYSYSIYLWHLIARDVAGLTVKVMSGTSPGFGAGAAVYVIGSLVVGVVMAKIVEVPALRLRDRWFPSLSHRHAE